MKNLIIKEFKLSVHPTNYLFLALAAMLLIPNYPYYVVFFYQTLGIFFIFLNGNTNNDIFFTTLLPIRKSDVIKARFYTVIICELLQIFVSIPFVIMRYYLIKQQNMAGMEANAALFGLVLIMFGIFNTVFLPMFFKTGYKTGVPFWAACFAMMVFVVVAEIIINIFSVCKTALDTIDKVYFLQQMAVLFIGIFIFALLTGYGFFQSKMLFNKLDL